MKGLLMKEDSSSQRQALTEILKTHDRVKVVFTKVNGDERTMFCTLSPNILPAQTDLEEQVQNKTPNPDTLVVWDIEAEGWRSFRLDSVIIFTYDMVYDD